MDSMYRHAAAENKYLNDHNEGTTLSQAPQKTQDLKIFRKDRKLLMTHAILLLSPSDRSDADTK